MPVFALRSSASGSTQYCEFSLEFGTGHHCAREQASAHLRTATNIEVCRWEILLHLSSRITCAAGRGNRRTSCGNCESRADVRCGSFFFGDIGFLRRFRGAYCEVYCGQSHFNNAADAQACLRLLDTKVLNRVTIEPTRPAWKAGVLPLNYARVAQGGELSLRGPAVKPAGRGPATPSARCHSPAWADCSRKWTRHPASGLRTGRRGKMPRPP
jgi:hypothetical protein